MPYLTVNNTGHVTSISEHTVKIPASNNTDTKMNVTLDAQGMMAARQATMGGLLFAAR